MLERRGSGSQWRCAGGIERCHERRAERADGAEKGEGESWNRTFERAL